MELMDFKTVCLAKKKKKICILSLLNSHPKLALDGGFVWWFDVNLWLTVSIVKVPWVLVLLHLSSIFDRLWLWGFAVLPIESLGTFASVEVMTMDFSLCPVVLWGAPASALLAEHTQVALRLKLADSIKKNTLNNVENRLEKNVGF